MGEDTFLPIPCRFTKIGDGNPDYKRPCIFKYCEHEVLCCIGYYDGVFYKGIFDHIIQAPDEWSYLPLGYF